MFPYRIGYRLLVANMAFNVETCQLKHVILRTSFSSFGHGGSDGLHGSVPSLDDAVVDMKAFLDKVLTQNPGLPCFCFGHSTGAAIILKAVLDPKVEARIERVVTSPAVGVQPSHPIYTGVAPIFSLLLPRYQCEAADKKGAVVSHDPDTLFCKVFRSSRVHWFPAREDGV
ncbi:hypothetical protein Ancab_012724 [Ancistrocladus abbreviatus]